MKKRFLTILLIPDQSTQVKRLVVPYLNLKVLIACSLTFAFLSLGFFGGFLRYRSLHVRDEAMRQENWQYRKELEQIRTKIASVETYVERVKRFDKKLRIITNLEDPERQVALGPLEVEELGIQEAVGLGKSGNVSSLRPDFPAPDSQSLDQSPTSLQNIQNLQGSLDELELAAAQRESSLQQLENKLKDMGALLRATPAIWPSVGWVTSNFGYRVSPFSGEKSMHEGLDIAARPGTAIKAPADGIVTFVGTYGSYGKTLVINHGYGMVTRYGHLSEIYSHLGDSVKRGETLAAIGNTGRSTGPHLHYEILVNGVPRDPKKYILN